MVEGLREGVRLKPLDIVGNDKDRHKSQDCFPERVQVFLREASVQFVMLSEARDLCILSVPLSALRSG
jgi:hypothetical protein